MTPPVTIFSPQQLQQIVNQTIPTSVPADHKYAIVVGADQTGAKVVARFKNSGGNWEFQAAAEHDWSGANSVGAQVIMSW